MFFIDVFFHLWVYTVKCTSWVINPFRVRVWVRWSLCLSVIRPSPFSHSTSGQCKKKSTPDLRHYFPYLSRYYPNFALFLNWQQVVIVSHDSQYFAIRKRRCRCTKLHRIVKHIYICIYIWQVNFLSFIFLKIIVTCGLCYLCEGRWFQCIGYNYTANMDYMHGPRCPLHENPLKLILSTHSFMGPKSNHFESITHVCKLHPKFWSELSCSFACRAGASTGFSSTSTSTSTCKLRVRVRVQVLDYCMGPSPSTGWWVRVPAYMIHSI